jgi:hypothetical protein
VRVAVLTTFAASRKEPLAAMLDRVYQGFLNAGIAEPFIQFNFGDGNAIPRRLHSQFGSRFQRRLIIRSPLLLIE